MEVPYGPSVGFRAAARNGRVDSLRADTRTVLCVDIADTSADAAADDTVAALADLSAAFHGTDHWVQVRDAAIATGDTPVSSVISKGDTEKACEAEAPSGLQLSRAWWPPSSTCCPALLMRRPRTFSC